MLGNYDEDYWEIQELRGDFLVRRIFYFLSLYIVTLVCECDMLTSKRLGQESRGSSGLAAGLGHCPIA